MLVNVLVWVCCAVLCFTDVLLCCVQKQLMYSIAESHGYMGSGPVFPMGSSRSMIVLQLTVANC